MVYKKYLENLELVRLNLMCRVIRQHFTSAYVTAHAPQ